MLWNEAVDDQRKKNWDSIGCQKTNLTRREERGMKKLSERKKKGDIVIIPTDK